MAQTTRFNYVTVLAVNDPLWISSVAPPFATSACFPVHLHVPLPAPLCNPAITFSFSCSKSVSLIRLYVAGLTQEFGTGATVPSSINALANGGFDFENPWSGWVAAGLAVFNHPIAHSGDTLVCLEFDSASLVASHAVQLGAGAYQISLRYAKDAASTSSQFVVEIRDEGGAVLFIEVVPTSASSFDFTNPVTSVWQTFQVRNVIVEKGTSPDRFDGSQ
jgi:hypothetical protein